MAEKNISSKQQVFALFFAGIGILHSFVIL